MWYQFLYRFLGSLREVSENPDKSHDVPERKGHCILTKTLWSWLSFRGPPNACSLPRHSILKPYWAIKKPDSLLQRTPPSDGVRPQRLSTAPSGHPYSWSSPTFWTCFRQKPSMMRSLSTGSSKEQGEERLRGSTQKLRGSWDSLRLRRRNPGESRQR